MLETEDNINDPAVASDSGGKPARTRSRSAKARASVPPDAATLDLPVGEPPPGAAPPDVPTPGVAVADAPPKARKRAPAKARAAADPALPLALDTVTDPGPITQDAPPTRRRARKAMATPPAAPAVSEDVSDAGAATAPHRSPASPASLETAADQPAALPAKRARARRSTAATGTAPPESNGAASSGTVPPDSNGAASSGTVPHEEALSAPDPAVSASEDTAVLPARRTRRGRGSGAAPTFGIGDPAAPAEPRNPLTPPVRSSAAVFFVPPAEADPATAADRSPAAEDRTDGDEAQPRRRRRATSAATRVQDDGAPVTTLDANATNLDDPAEHDRPRRDRAEDDATGQDRRDEEVHAADAAWSADGGDTDPDGPRRRRRRGRRGRGARSETEGEAGTDTVADDAEPVLDADSDDAGAEGDADVDAEDEGEVEGGTARRRRRRRRGGASEEPGTTAGDEEPPGTVGQARRTRAPATRRTESTDAVDEVRGIRGSSRLEAKRQRRRDGREVGRRRAPILTEAEFLARRESVDRVMAVRQRGDRTQIAILEDGVLVEHYVTRASATSYVGNVYLGRVQNVLPSMEAAFIDIGKGRNGVLYAGEVNWDAAGLEGKSRAIEAAMKSGDALLVQVTKDPIGHKGARLTSQVSLPGRFLVYVPGGGMTGISRKLPDTERHRLKAILKKIVPEEAGVIVRTAAEGASEEDLTRDVERLKLQWAAIADQATKPGDAPVLVHGEPELATRVVRDVFNEDFQSMIVDGEQAWAEVAEYVEGVAPELASRVSRHTAETDLFRDLRVDEQLAKALDRKVWLPSGGSLVIDRTEAMTVIDVNTGKYTGSGGNLESTVTKNNLEAAEEIVRQLRLRDIGGIIVIDFIDMVLESNRDLVLRRLTECLGRDRTKHQVAEVTSLGLVQMTRKRVGEGLLEAFSEPCEHCKGRGVIVHSEPVDQHDDRESAGRGNGGAAGDGTASRGGRRSRAQRAEDQPADAEAAEHRRQAAAAMNAIARGLHPDPHQDAPGVVVDPSDGALGDSADGDAIDATATHEAEHDRGQDGETAAPAPIDFAATAPGDDIDQHPSHDAPAPADPYASPWPGPDSAADPAVVAAPAPAPATATATGNGARPRRRRAARRPAGPPQPVAVPG